MTKKTFTKIIPVDPENHMKSTDLPTESRSRLSLRLGIQHADQIHCNKKHESFLISWCKICVKLGRVRYSALFLNIHHGNLKTLGEISGLNVVD
jgi:hypothetical protein